jgi:hypothetical protein
MSNAIFIRPDDPTGKSKPVINCHQVWDSQKFLQSQIKQHNGEKDAGELRIVSVVDEAEYRQHRGWKGYQHAA